MKKLAISVSLAAASAALFLISDAPDVVAQDAPAAAAPAGVQQWEYRVVRIDDSRPEEAGRRPTSRSGGAEEALNELGAEGWELVAMRLDAVSSRNAPIFYFKRPKS